MRRKWSGHDVPSAASRGCSLARQEVEDDVRVGEVADLRAVGGGEAADQRQERGRALAPRVGRRAARDPATTGPNGSGRPSSAMNRSAVRMISSEFASHSSEVSPQAVMPWPPRIAPIASGWSRADRGDVEAELEAGPAPRDPGHPVAEAAAGQRLAVGGGRERDAGVRVEVVDVGGVDEPVHRGVDRRRRAAAAVQAVVERGDHLVLALDARVDVDERAQPVQAQDGEAGLGQRAEVAAGALDPQQLDRACR